MKPALKEEANRSTHIVRQRPSKPFNLFAGFPQPKEFVPWLYQLFSVAPRKWGVSCFGRFGCAARKQLGKTDLRRME
jgi:hypothetical protein